MTGPAKDEGAGRSYRAFISYSHADAATVRWLHRAIETFRLPARIVGQPTPLGPAPRRLIPLFRDRDELPASGDLGHELRTALSRSLRLIVVCSPRSARSQWVNEEILTFKRMHGEAGVLALILAGDPGATDRGKPDEECFPPALRYRLGPDNELSSEPAHPIAADMRREGDGRRGALLKLIAGLAAVPLDQLIQREAQRRVRRAGLLVAGSLTGMAVTGALAFEANRQRLLAERESAAARAASSFLIGTFSISNPATENPRTITALSILRNSAERASLELGDQPDIRLRLLGTVGEAYVNLGLFDEARNALEPALPLARARGAEGAPVLQTLASAYRNKGDFTASLNTVAQAEALLGPNVGEHSEIRGDLAQTRAQVQQSMANYSAAEAAFQAALAHYAEAKDVKPRKLARVYLNYGLTLSSLGHDERARAALIKGLELARRATGPKSRMTGQALSVLAFNERAAGRYAEGKAHIDEAISILGGVLDPDNPIIADALSQRGQILYAQGEPALAIKDFDRAIAILKQAYGGPHFKIGSIQGYLALAQSQLGDTSSALRSLDESKRNYDAHYKKLHVNHGDLLVQRAQVLARAGRRQEARADCTEGLSLMRRLEADDAFYQTAAGVCAKI
ncbi:toll/interleukin-1 receptor domain-containing protein [Phenylobacterium sp.]|uniref:toll/interleukin-1 receptor domain-containing protein n=1 Tax=Phenylobacterium sp. TaxID=1871053 RepID=UPI0025F6D6CF|nr:toll/interleukin-1 receptor domain-containing protein [Phenylobacterium sp.]